MPNNIWRKIDSGNHNRLNESSRRKYEKLRSGQSISPPVQSTPQRNNNRIGEKILFFVIAIPVVIAVGMLFPGVAHGILAYATWMAYKNIFE